MSILALGGAEQALACPTQNILSPKIACSKERIGKVLKRGLGVVLATQILADAGKSDHLDMALYQSECKGHKATADELWFVAANSPNYPHTGRADNRVLYKRSDAMPSRAAHTGPRFSLKSGSN
jgi:hypothetical protein